MANLFVYGTLMDKSRLYKLTGKYFSTTPATLKDFRKLDSHLGHPYVVPEKSSEVQGLIIKDMDPQSMQKLDSYEDEGQLYMRKKVTVTCDGKEILCETYVGNRRLLTTK